MTINNANVEQINVALLDLDKRIKALNIDNEAIKSLQNSVKTIKSSLNETKAGLQSGATYNINISGNASTATKAATATTAVAADRALEADSVAEANHANSATNATNATNANLSKTLDTVNGDKLQIGSGTAQNITNAKHAATADNISAGGTSGQVLTSNGPSTAPSWQDQKPVDENTIKSVMKPNYTTSRLPAGIYNVGQTVSVSASITTTRGNPVFISYSGDFNSVGAGNTVPWVWFKLYVDGNLVQTTTVDNSSALTSDNTAFAGNALVVLSAGSHTIRLDAELYEGSNGKVHFQEQDNIVNLVAFEL